MISKTTFVSGPKLYLKRKKCGAIIDRKHQKIQYFKGELQEHFVSFSNKFFPVRKFSLTVWDNCDQPLSSKKKKKTAFLKNVSIHVKLHDNTCILRPKTLILSASGIF